MEITHFGTTANGDAAQLFTLTNKDELTAKITNFGATLLEMHVPDRHGTFNDITLGPGTLHGCQNNLPFFGVIAGRFANRIANAQFQINGTQYHLAKNDGPNHLHGGKIGFNKKLWKATPLPLNNATAIRLNYSSPDGEEGYPGTLDVTIDYSLTNTNELRIHYQAVSNKPTPINLTNHAYWNLQAENAGHIGNHQIQIHAEFYTPINASLIPTGEIRSVADTPFDFTSPTPLSDRIAKTSSAPNGYDHNFVLRKSEPNALEPAATVKHPTSGRRLDILTTEPGIQFYTGNFLDGTLNGKSGKPYHYQAGFSLECQHFPDSPNQPHFPTTILQPGAEYRQTTIYRFSIDRQN